MPPMQEATVTPVSKTPVWKWDVSKLGILKIPISNSLSFKVGSNLIKLQKSTVSKMSLIQPVKLISAKFFRCERFGKIA